MKKLFTIIALFVSLGAFAQSGVSDKVAEAFQKKDWKTGRPIIQNVPAN